MPAFNYNQNTTDVTVQACGDISALIQLSLINNISITDDVQAGFEFIAPVVINQSVVDYLNKKNAIPATTKDAALHADNKNDADVFSVKLVTLNVFNVKQNLADVAVQHNGDVSAVIQLALLNNISVSDVLLPGTQFNASPVLNNDVVSYMQKKKIIPATGDVDVAGERVLRGVGYDVVGDTDVVYPE